MSNAYDKMLNRLNAYRQMQNMSQENMGSVMGITQSHYSKLEKGKKIDHRECLHGQSPAASGSHERASELWIPGIDG